MQHRIMTGHHRRPVAPLLPISNGCLVELAHLNQSATVLSVSLKRPHFGSGSFILPASEK